MEARKCMVKERKGRAFKENQSRSNNLQTITKLCHSKNSTKGKKRYINHCLIFQFFLFLPSHYCFQKGSRQNLLESGG